MGYDMKKLFRLFALAALLWPAFAQADFQQFSPTTFSSTYFARQSGAITLSVSSANLATAVTGETGTGALVFNTGPTLSGATLSGNTTLPGSGQISSTGLLGVGGTPPAGIEGYFTSAGVTNFRLDTSIADDVQFEWYKGGVAKWTARNDSTGSAAADAWVLANGSGTDALSVSQTGIVGINTITPYPTASLDIRGSGGRFYLRNTGATDSNTLGGALFTHTTNGTVTVQGAQSTGAGTGVSFTVDLANGRIGAGTGATAPQATINTTGNVLIGTAAAWTASNGQFGLAKITDPGTAPGAGITKIHAMAGTNAGTCKLVAYAGTSTTPVTIVDNIGSGC